jgi:glycyl-tRNA synthetase
MRELARGVAEAYLAQREALGFPWKRLPGVAGPDTRPPDRDTAPPPGSPAPLALEVGTEELPVDDLESALAQLEQGFSGLLETARLGHGAWKVMGTPRRLLVSIEGLAPRQEEQVRLVKGPPADRAFDGDGHATPAAQGFARSRGVAVEALRVHEIDGGRYAVAEVREPGRSADEVLAQAIPEILAGLRFDRSMRWGAEGVAFSRPIRWLVCLHGEHLVPFAFAGLRSGRTTRGLRFSEPEEIRARDAGDLLAQLGRQGVIPDVGERREKIRQGVEALAREVGGRPSEDPGLLREVTDLVEAPAPLRGAFEERFLDLPRPVLVEVMRKHQRYFAVEDGERLLPYFITVRNGGGPGMDLVAHGNEQVIRARFADAAYFIRKDLDKPLEDHLPRLATLTFQARLGSMLDKTARIERLSGLLAQEIGLAPAERGVAARAAHLCKADLATQMVVEMTALQGEMGREYAMRAGEPPAVAEAILEHHLPRFAGDRTPRSRAGLVVGLADRLDTLIGLFAAGMEPTATKDPFALRRAAIGLAQILIAQGQRFDLRRGLEQAAAGLPIPCPPQAIEDCLGFVLVRVRGVLEADHRHDVVEAVQAAQGHDPAGAAQAAADLEARVTRSDWPQILQAFARCVRITRDQAGAADVREDWLKEPAEQALFQALRTAEGRPRAAGSVPAFLDAFAAMIPAISRFFEVVLVMVDDESLRANRLALLRRIAGLADGVADFSRLEGF